MELAVGAPPPEGELEIWFESYGQHIFAFESLGQNRDFDTVASLIKFCLRPIDDELRPDIYNLQPSDDGPLLLPSMPLDEPLVARLVAMTKRPPGKLLLVHSGRRTAPSGYLPEIRYMGGPSGVEVADPKTQQPRRHNTRTDGQPVEPVRSRQPNAQPPLRRCPHGPPWFGAPLTSRIAPSSSSTLTGATTLTTCRR